MRENDGVRLLLIALAQVGLPVALAAGLETHVLVAGLAVGFAVSTILWSLLWARGGTNRA